MNLWQDGITARYNRYTRYGERFKYMNLKSKEYWNHYVHIVQGVVPYN